MARRSFSPIPALALLTLCCLPYAAAAADGPTRLTVEPVSVTLRGRWDRSQLVVTGRFASGQVRDLTAGVTWTVEGPAAVSPGGVVTPRGNGRAVVVARFGGVEARVPVQVDRHDKPDPVSFVGQVIPTLTKAGCNAGACHGTPTGKNGFKLSLRGYDPALDLVSLTREFTGRRLSLQAPDQSLFLRKATGQMPHEGGKRFDRNSPLYQLVRQWVAEGARADADTAPRLVRLEISPSGRLLEAPADGQQLRVAALGSDGVRRDVTHLARYSVNDEAIAAVSPGGRVEKRTAGEVAVIAEYRNQMATALITFLESRPGFVWSPPPENNYSS